MAIPINVEDLLNKQKIESNRIEFKKGWNPTSIYHSICAFANDFEDLGGGYILVGVNAEEKSGLAIRPIEGLPIEEIDKILKEMIGYNNKISPYYMPRTSVEEVDGKHLLVIWCPAGINRPYSVPENVMSKTSKENFYVRSGTSSIVAKGEVLDELRTLASRIPFDERGNPDIKLDDISTILLRDYMVKIGSRLEKELYKRPLNEILEQMDLYSGPTERQMLRNVAAMMFCEHPEKIFCYTQVDIVIFPNGRTKDPNNFSETTIYGSVPQLISGALTYLKNNIIREYVIKQKNVPESIRYFNYPIQALEEAIVNSLYHRDYQQYEPVEISVEPEGIHILSFPGPDRSISESVIKEGSLLRSRRYRNRRLGDFLKELNLTEGRSTGIPTIQEELQKNGSPRASIETNDDRTFINIFIPIHEGCGDTVILNVPHDVTHDVTHELGSKLGSRLGSEYAGLNETRIKILSMIREDNQISIAQMAEKLGLSTTAVEKNLTYLKNNGYLIREGKTSSGYWEIKTSDKNK